MRTRKNRLRRGGDAIAGMQGCVIIPSLLVDVKMKTRNTSYVTKIFFKDEDYDEERAHNDMVISTIDPRNSFTSANYTTTPVDLRYLTPSELKSCGKLKGVDLTTLKYLNYKYLGKSLDEIVNTNMKIDLTTCKNIIIATSNLATKILYLNNDLKLFHNDVHEGNIMYNFKEEHAYLIDFGGLSSKPNNGNESTDLQGLISSLRLLVTSVVNQKKLLQRYIDMLSSFLKDSSLVLVRSSEIKDPVESRSLIIKFLTDFSLSFVKTGGGKKTLRNKLHRNMHSL
jgi:serine/threonine protein kinase